MPVPSKTGYIPPDQAQILVNHLDRVKDQCISIAQDVINKTGDQITVTRMAQFVVLVLLHFVLGLVPGVLHSMLEESSFSKVHDWIAGLEGEFPGYSTGYKHYTDIFKHVGEEIKRIASELQDTFQQEIGRNAREKFNSVLDAQHMSIVPGADCFIGIIPPNEVLGAYSVFDRGVLLPFLNAWIYMHGRKITSTNEYAGMLKTPTIEGDQLYFPLAGTLGFYHGPPGINEIYFRFRQIDKIIESINKDVNIELVKAGIMDMTVVTIDTTNIPVDKKDKTGSIGTGSRGTFFGHKEAASADANCIPLAGTSHEGRKGDAATFDGVFEPAKEVAVETGQDMWATCVDAGFATPNIVDEIEGAGAVAFVMINPKHSERLKALVTNSEALDELSAKAFNSLTIEERQSWRERARAKSTTNKGPVPLDEKKDFMKRELRNLAARAIRKGLTSEEKRDERRLREEVTRARREIRLHGTDTEKKLGMTTIPLGTTEWKLVYATRGQNEGINSILKKRGDIIGDGQHTSWLHGAKVIGPRCNAAIVGIKIVALGANKIMGKVRHCLEWLHNWRKPRYIFVIVVIMIFCR